MKSTLCFILLCLSFYSNASVIINGTRIIYHENDKEVTVKLTNKGNDPVLVQSWIDNGDINNSPDNIQVPFDLSPPINKLDGNKSQTLRLSYSGDNLPKDKESVFWFNALEIPQTKATAASNRLQIAYRTRIKLFYRPDGLPESPIVAANSVSWTRTSEGLIAKNNSPYFISLVDITYSVSGKKRIIDGDMLAPFESHSFSIENKKDVINNIEYSYINDWGAVHSKMYKL